MFEYLFYIIEALLTNIKALLVSRRYCWLDWSSCNLHRKS